MGYCRIERYKKLKRGYRIMILVAIVSLLWYIFSLPSPLFNSPYSTVVTDREGRLIGARIARDQQWRFPPVASLPVKYRIALMQFEDRYFRLHPGVNPVSIFRALWQNIKEGRVVSGGSTITMQTIRLMRGKRRSYFEKMVESIMATRLELSYSKDEILALYASHAPMGGNVVGIEAASWRFFGHSSSTLSWSEAATLAVLPNSPAMTHPGRGRKMLLKKRNELLKQIYDNRFLTESDYRLAIEEPLPDKPHPLPKSAPHLVAQLNTTHNGQQIRTTIDAKLQSRVEETLNRWYGEFSQNGIHNIAAMVLDVESNSVLSYCGNVNFEESGASNQVDIICSPRSTGSILKPFLYTAAIQEGSLIFRELLPDVPINIAGFTPKNFSLNYDGAVYADEALARSLNIPFVILLRRYGVEKFYDLLKKAGLSTLARSSGEYGLSLILGGAEGTLWDVAAIYLGMAQTLLEYNRGGRYFETKPPSVIYGAREEGRETVQPLFNAGAIWLTLEAMTNVNRPEEIDWRFIPSMRKIAWKTGTSYGFRDGWSIGVTPKYVVAVWVGNSSGEGRAGLTGANTAGRVMFDLFNLLPNTGWFQKPYGELVETVICKESGALLGVDCPESSADTVLVPVKALNGAVCKYHRVVHLSKDMKYRVFKECAGKRGVLNTSWFVLPPVWESYYRDRHPAYRSLPPYSPECLGEANVKSMEFIYPFSNSVIKIPKQLDGTKGRVVFELAHRDRQASVFWHLLEISSGESIYLGETVDLHKMDINSRPGRYLLSVVDNYGDSISIYITIE